MKLEKAKKDFEPYKITVETKEEHEHLYGLFNQARAAGKGDYEEYDDYIDCRFQNLLEGINHES